MTQREQQALDRVEQAGVKANETEILSWIRSVSPEAILAASLIDIREVAGAF